MKMKACYLSWKKVKRANWSLLIQSSILLNHHHVIVKQALLKKMEEIGIGRPSTYAAIISVLQDREYVTLDNKRFIPSSRGKIVTIFLETFFQRCIEYNFTAQMEEKLDLISNGRADWKKELGYFWVPFFNLVNSVKQMTHDEIFSGIHSLVVDWFCSEEGKKEIGKKMSWLFWWHIEIELWKSRSVSRMF